MVGNKDSVAAAAREGWDVKDRHFWNKLFKLVRCASEPRRGQSGLMKGLGRGMVSTGIGGGRSEARGT